MSSQPPAITYASAGGVVTDPAGQQVLVLLRPGRLGPDGRPEVRLPKGHIEPDENRRQAALREVREEAGLANLRLLIDLGHQVVEFDWQGHHHVRDESYFLMIIPRDASTVRPEKQFERLWLAWDQALARLTFQEEKEWIRRARVAWTEQQPAPGPHSLQSQGPL